MEYLFGFGLAFVLSAGLTPWVRRYALARGIVDRPSTNRKIHTREVAYLGGVAIFAAFVIAVMVLLPMSRQLASLLLGCLILVAVGVIDDIRDLSPGIKLAGQFLAAGVALAGGIGITAITNPFGGVIDLSWGRMNFELLGAHFHVMPVANILSLLWMVGLANTINFLDGLDGLAVRGVGDCGTGDVRCGGGSERASAGGGTIGNNSGGVGIGILCRTISIRPKFSWAIRGLIFWV